MISVEQTAALQTERLEGEAPPTQTKASLPPERDSRFALGPMRGLSAAELLGVWEGGLAQSPVQRSLLLLSSACGDVPVEQLATLTIGQRNAHLLTLRASLFGPKLTGLASCPSCTERVEVQVNVADIRLNAEAEPTGPLTLQAGDYVIAFRPPNSLDVERLDASAGIAANRRRLLEQCVFSARRGAEGVSVGQLPEEVVQRIAERMAQADPQGDVQLSLRCPSCAHQWQAPLDIVSFLWAEVHAWAMRLLREVHALALAYGWRETDILALSPWRRQAYLELLGS